MRKIQKYNRFFGGQAPLRMMKQTNYHCERSVPQATPTGGPVRDERSEHAISDRLPRAHALVKTETGQSAFSCHPCQGERERESMPRQARHDTIMLPCHCELTPIRHCERSDAISYGLPRAHALAMTEVGRSIVEMLGVLAIMGVVGLVGVRMYTNAMNRHRANELIYEANKRATMVAMQITAGNENLSITDFTNPTGYTFGVEKNPQNANQFNITITGVSTDVCTQMKTAVGPATSIRVISNTCNKLTFNNDLSKTFYVSDYATKEECIAKNKTWCSGKETCAEENCCAEFDQDASPCQRCDTTSGAVLVTLANGTSCSTDTITDGYCHNGSCLEKSTDANCIAGGVVCHDSTLQDDCCPVGSFCTTNGDKSGKCIQFGDDIECTTNDDCQDKYPDGTKPFCFISFTGTGGNAIPSSGTCTALTGDRYEPIEDTILGLGDIVISKGSMNFWNARNWCAALPGHKTLISQEDIQCYRNGEALCLTGQRDMCYCCAKGKQCPRSSWGSKWTTDENNHQVISDEDAALYSPIIVAIRKKYYGSKNYIWTASDWAANNGTRIQLINGYFDNGSRSANGIALCK